MRVLIAPCPWVCELTLAVRERQEETARVPEDGRPELRPGRTVAREWTGGSRLLHLTERRL
jgi:hypothetical protein